jgi:hypothetical protein
MQAGLFQASQIENEDGFELQDDSSLDNPLTPPQWPLTTNH